MDRPKVAKLTPRQQEEKGANIARQERINAEGQKKHEAKVHAEEQAMKETVQRQLFSMTRTERQQLDINRRHRFIPPRLRSYTFLLEHSDRVSDAYVSVCCKAVVYSWKSSYGRGVMEAYFKCRKCGEECEIKHKKGRQEVQFLE